MPFRFEGLAVGETSEVVGALFPAFDRKCITRAQQSNIYEWADELAYKINAFRNTLRKAIYDTQ